MHFSNYYDKIILFIQSFTIGEIINLEIRNRKIKLTFSRVLAGVLVLLLVDAVLKYSSGLGKNNSAEKIITEFASQNGFTLDDYPAEIQKMLVQNEETKEFVINYPKKITHFQPEKLDFSEYKDCTQPPHLMQWDMRWGYMNYSGNVFGLTGSAPTCLSMAAIYVMHDVNMTPVHIAGFSRGTAFETEPEKLLSNGARAMGMNVAEVSRNNQRLREAVTEKGCAVICMLKSQDLSQFVLITGISEDGNFIIQDPSSKKLSQKGYSYVDLQNRGIKRIWKYSLPSQSTDGQTPAT